MIQTKVNNKVVYLKHIFNNDINACIRLCDRMIKHNDCFEIEFYKQVKKVLENESI